MKVRSGEIIKKLFFSSCQATVACLEITTKTGPSCHTKSRCHPSCAASPSLCHTPGCGCREVAHGICLVQCGFSKMAVLVLETLKKLVENINLSAGDC